MAQITAGGTDEIGRQFWLDCNSVSQLTELLSSDALCVADGYPPRKNAPRLVLPKILQ